MISGLRPRGGAAEKGVAAQALRALHAQEAGGAPGPAPAPPLAEVEAALDALGDLAATELITPGRMLAPGICVQFQGDAGVRARIEGLNRALPRLRLPGLPEGEAPRAGQGAASGLRIALETRGESPWFSLEIALPSAPLAAARALCLRLSGRSGSGVVSLRPTLRMGFDDGWSDARFPADFAFTPQASRQMGVLPLDALPNRQAGAPVLILFLRQPAAILSLERVELILGV